MITITIHEETNGIKWIHTNIDTDKDLNLFIQYAIWSDMPDDKFADLIKYGEFIEKLQL